MKIVASLLVFAGAVDAATKIAVVELGVGGAVRRTSSQSSRASLEGVGAFLSSMHGTRRLQHAGMSVVPDLFKKADAGVVVGLSGSGVDMASMPSVAALINGENKNVIGHMETPGFHCNALLSRTSGSEEISGGLSQAVEKASLKGSLTGVKMTVSDATVANSVDEDISALIREMDEKSKEAGRTVVLYLVIEDDFGVESRRRLAENQNKDQQGQYQQGQYYYFKKSSYADNEEGGQAGDEEDNVFANMFAGYYGYGYYNSYGEWVTPYKSMFQIQYFNVVLWTALGLFVLIVSTIMMMMNMPLEPDTLLFGESAKMVGED